MPPHVLYRVLDNHNRIQAPPPPPSPPPLHIFTAYLWHYFILIIIFDLGFAT